MMRFDFTPPFLPYLFALCAGCMVTSSCVDQDSKPTSEPSQQTSSQERTHTQSTDADPSTNTDAHQRVATTSESLFIDATTKAGLLFRHNPVPTDKFWMREIVGAGVGLFDYDNDGDLDVYVIQGGHGANSDNQKITASQETLQTTNRLFRNDLDSEGRLQFVDVTDETGTADSGYGMGVATADIDNDGDIDFYVTNFGDNALYVNRGDGRFENTTHAAGVNDTQWSASASFSDFNADGLVDLFVTNYVADSLVKVKNCKNSSGRTDYCSPKSFSGTTDTLFENLSQAKFQNISERSGINAFSAAGLGVAAADFDQDGRIDIYVANDQEANFMWRNLGQGRFEESGLITGTAYNGHGMAEASMGLAVADFDDDGDEDLFMTHLNKQTNTLYANDGKGNFSDATDKARLDTASLAFTGFGTHWFDVDNDSDLDVFIANGAVIMEPELMGKSSFPYAQRNQLFVNHLEQRSDQHTVSQRSNKLVARYVEWRGQPNDPLEAVAVSRGSAIGDIDNDGDVDIVINNSNGAAQLLINQQATETNWLGITLRGVESNRDGTGARVALSDKRGAQIWRRAHTDGSYLSANDSRVLFGLAAPRFDDKQSFSVTVHWPRGLREQWHDIPRGQYSQLVEGSGKSIAEFYQ